jgi:hypothetical protein
VTCLSRLIQWIWQSGRGGFDDAVTVVEDGREVDYCSDKKFGDSE